MATSKKTHIAPIEHQVLLKRDGTLRLPAEIAAQFSGQSYLIFRRHPNGVHEAWVPTSPVIEPGTERVSLNADGTLTFPKQFSIFETEDTPFGVTQRPDGVIELRSLEPRDPDQWWYWTEEWQQMEREADADIAAGRVRVFDDVESFLADLDADPDP